ncbi:MAG: hypothetical protein POELPBGB_03051 [Bacteroidia bacterium]|nr:hypothetical protein [Bacteroidia bacterium]
MPMKTISFKQIIKFNSEPHEVYNALMDSKTHSSFTGSKAIIGKNIGDDFSAYEGYITGKNIELVPGKKIVQFWKTTDKGWRKNYFSIIEFVFIKKENGTELQFSHKNIPANITANYAQGWEDYYWKPMKSFLEK